MSEGVTIRYTTNGFDSTSSSLIYSASIFLDSTCYSKFNLFSVQNSPDSDWNPPHAVEHIIVIKAALFDSNGNRKGDISTANCIIKDLIGRHIDLPVMSICSDSTSLLSQDDTPWQWIFYDKDVCMGSTQRYLGSQIGHHLARFRHPSSHKNWTKRIENIRRYFDDVQYIMRNRYKCFVF